MSIQLWHSENGFILNSQSYDFEQVDSVVVTRNERRHLTRGANSRNKKGLPYKENSKTPDSVAFNVLDLPAPIVTILRKAYEDETRLDFYCIDSVTGENFTGKDAIITHFPQQLNIVEGEETYNVELTFETFNLTPVAK